MVVSYFQEIFEPFLWCHKKMCKIGKEEKKWNLDPYLTAWKEENPTTIILYTKRGIIISKWVFM